MDTIICFTVSYTEIISDPERPTSKKKISKSHRAHYSKRRDIPAHITMVNVPSIGNCKIYDRIAFEDYESVWLGNKGINLTVMTDDDKYEYMSADKYQEVHKTLIDNGYRLAEISEI